jgi:2-haloalkanoic acid dehalogenase type II
LIDWNFGLGDALVRAAALDGQSVAREALVDAYHDLEPMIQAEAHRSYRQVLAETARRVGERLGWEMSAAAADLVPNGLPDWPPFPDTNAALERLYAAGHKLGILSNVDDDLLEATRKRLSVPFGLVITAQQVGSYKPAHGHFLTARQSIGEARWLHAAQSYFHDVVPARELGIPVVWINRQHEQPSGEARPDREFSLLSELADWLA